MFVEYRRYCQVSIKVSDGFLSDTSGGLLLAEASRGLSCHSLHDEHKPLDGRAGVLAQDHVVRREHSEPCFPADSFQIRSAVGEPGRFKIFICRL